MKDFLRSEIVAALIDAGLKNGFAVRRDVSIHWNSLRSRNGSIEVGWYDADSERLIAVWNVRSTASDTRVMEEVRWTSSELFDGCPATLKIDVVNANLTPAASPAGVLQIYSHEVVRSSAALDRLVSLAAMAEAQFHRGCSGVARFLYHRIPDALPTTPRCLRPFSRGVRIKGVSTHPRLVSTRWIEQADHFIDAPNIPDNFYAAGMVGTQAEELVFVMRGGLKRFWFIEPYLSFVGGEMSIETMRRSFAASVAAWARDAGAEGCSCEEHQWRHS